MSFLLPFVPLGVAAMYAERALLPPLLVRLEYSLTHSLMHSLVHALSGARAFGLVLLVNVVASGFLLVGLGMKVGRARALLRDKAAKDGEADAEARYSLPNMYVSGDTLNAKKFNCVQRGHQQALETYPQFLALSLCGGYCFPLLTAAMGLLWMYARSKWAEGYASGDPASRYDHWSSKGIWLALLLMSMTTVGTALTIMELI